MSILALLSSVLTPVVRTSVSPRRIETERKQETNLTEEALLVPLVPMDLILRTGRSKDLPSSGTMPLSKTLSLHPVEELLLSVPPRATVSLKLLRKRTRLRSTSSFSALLELY